MISIRRSTSDDPAFGSLVAELDQDLLNRYGLKQSQYDIHNKGLEEASVVIALHNDTPIGCACYKVIEQAYTVEIKRMYVQPTFRRLGVAQQLLADLELWAKKTGHSKTILQTATKQPESIALYRKCGYQPTDCYGTYQGDEDSVCMEKQLWMVT